MSILLIQSVSDNSILFYGNDIKTTETGMYVIDSKLSVPMSDNMKLTNCGLELPSDFAPRRYCYTEDNGFYINERYVRAKLQEAIHSKVSELDNTCERIIHDGTDVTLSDGNTKHFTLDEKDQANLTGIAIELITGADVVMWHVDDHSQHCEFYSPEDAWTIIKTLTAFKKYHITYFRDLRIYVENLTDEERVREVSYGFELPDEFKSDVLKSLESSL